MAEPASEYPYLLPLPDGDTQPWWDGIRRHELLLQQCAQCQTFRHPPQGTCPKCYSERVEWVRVSGRGTVYTYIVVYHPVVPQWQESAPYNVAQVAPEEAPHIRIYGNVINIDDEDIRVGMPVEIVFDDVTPENTIPRWQPR